MLEFENLTKDELFAFNYGTIILEVKKDINVEEEFKDCLYKVVGKTIEFCSYSMQKNMI